MPELPRVAGAHLVGSINQPTAESTFRVVSEHLGTDLARIPDGEVGERFHWMLFQGAAFEATAGLSRVPIEPIMHAGFDLRPFVLDGSVPADDIRFASLGYAAAAIASYSDFVALREAGVIEAGTRFQVSLPSALAPITTYAAPQVRAALLPAYTDALVRELDAIADAIPAADLAVQLDLATEFAYMEAVNLGAGVAEPFFLTDDERSDGGAGLIHGIARIVAPIAARVPAGAELGFHLCYGDVAEKHFTEPHDAANLTAVANALADAVDRPIQWVHLPVPIERDDDGYFAPLASLRLGDATRLYLGLVHHEDGVEGALRRIAAARPALTASGIEVFGVGTECGFGRGPAERTAPLLDLHHAVIAAAN
ncbi:hypothetical protein WDJ51_15405 [Rathayibacter sp. YIM 133350]|uniref:hypothetical protein n=1 Tax=Rathayibacter sp. YIM 133350 TaxID=3131992 RepID=UPI00307F1D64